MLSNVTLPSTTWYLKVTPFTVFSVLIPSELYLYDIFNPLLLIPASCLPSSQLNVCPSYVSGFPIASYVIALPLNAVSLSFQFVSPYV
ncbi:hypothetical protein [Romboutsia sp.]|uniref:hypothetical protein n=1 Tax=Romboutsia sp. TaxID=1965302 RepID=UPI002D01561B|nr:hypothetical protein [Romboutsia sp.]HSQ88800.1 hypothetical protein [Romboutsia sp.]